MKVYFMAGGNTETVAGVASAGNELAVFAQDDVED